MHLQSSEQDGQPPSKYNHNEYNTATETDQHLDHLSPVFPFGTPSSVSQINGTAYLTSQTLVQQVAYALSDKLFTYSPSTFFLDTAVKQWASSAQKNASGNLVSVDSMETRLGAANVLLGYVFSADATKRAIAQTIIASSATLTAMRPALAQLALLYKHSSPFVAHVAAVDYEVATSRLVTDYVAPMEVCRETGAGLVASFSAHEAQHMALFATIASTVLPMVHVFDGVRASRETNKVADVLDVSGLKGVWDSITGEVDETVDQVTKVNRILKSLNAELGTAYGPFEYEGHQEPDAVLVVFGSVEASLATQITSSLVKGGEKVGVISVRIYSPFDEEKFLAALPKSVKRIAVLGQVINQLAAEDLTVQSSLFTDVVAAVSMSDIWNLPPPIVDVKYPREHIWSPKEFAWIFEQIATKTAVSIFIPEDALTTEAGAVDSFALLTRDPSAKQYVFWDGDETATTPAAAVVSKILAAAKDRNVAFSATYDNVAAAGTLHSEIRTSSESIEAPFAVEGADVVFVSDVQLLGRFDVVKGVKKGGVIAIKASISAEDLEKKLPAPFRKAVVGKDAQLVLVDTAVVTEELTPAIENALVQLVFFKVAGVEVSVEQLGALNQDAEAVEKASGFVEQAIINIETKKEWAELSEEEVVAALLPNAASPNAFSVNEEKHVTEPASILKSSQSAAQALCFKEAFGVDTALRPELTMKNFIVKVKENKRLTPLDYDRNIFHIEFDLAGTGLTYEIGEALGIHSQNDTAEVSDFIQWYGLNATDLVHVPSREDPDILEIRTTFQALQQNIDIFGRPPKKFYESLAEFATDAEEQKALLAICSPDGATEFKRRAEVDTVTYADILKEHRSAHPSIADLIKIVAPLKRREYSIASSQKAHPDSVHLLIVVVNWTDPQGRDRFGQATRYLSTLPIGAEVVVSVKPSVMKLPADPTAPLIMAGLGTGLAPFRAFVQHRAWQKSQGLEIGPVMLFMGSRHQRQEYLYGEEWEAYIDAGIVTHMGAAFSRDQRRKIYIQDRMREVLSEVGEKYIGMKGSFYLCGPTWPVPDVAAVLEDAIRKRAETEGRKVDVGHAMEELKEEGRYVLEVY